MARDIIIPTRVSEDEHFDIQNRFKLSKLPTISEFMRQAARYGVIQPPPPPEYFATLHDVRAQGNNINQIAFIANASKSVSPEDVLELQRLHKELIAAVKALK